MATELFRSRILVFIFLILLLVAGCSLFSSAPEVKSKGVTKAEVPAAKKITTPVFSGRLAVIFRMDDVAKGLNEEAVETIIRLFGKYNVPVDCGVIPHNNGTDSYEVPFLKEYLNSGIVDISIHSNQHLNVEFETTKSGQTYEKLKAGLLLAREQIKRYYGVDPISFTVPYDFFNRDGYRAVQDAGFKIFSTQKTVEPYPSKQPLDYDGNIAENGLIRLCTVSDVARWDPQRQLWGDIFSADPKGELFYAIDWGLDNLGLAVVGIHPQAFTDTSKKVNKDKLVQLEGIIKACIDKAEITTFKAWHQYMSGSVITKPFERKTSTPAFEGGRAVIFRMDDAQKNFNEEAIEKLIQIFQQNGIPLDVGVMPFAFAPNSYEMPFLRKYLDAGVIDISVHGIRNTYNEFDTRLSGLTFEELGAAEQICFKNYYGQVNYAPVKTNYDDLTKGLIRARQEFKQYFGVSPVSFTVPNNEFDEAGYRAVQNAGFKVFSSAIWVDNFPIGEMSLLPVDYFFRKDSSGMYRLPTIADLYEWDVYNCTWGSMIRYDDAFETLPTALDAGVQSYVHVAVLSFHPQSFVDNNGKLVPAMANHLIDIIRYIKARKGEFGPVTTFRAWYEYMSQKQPVN